MLLKDMAKLLRFDTRYWEGIGYQKNVEREVGHCKEW